jgi:hypothetical protein
MASNDASPWPTVTLIGVLAGITFGLVLYSLIRRQSEGGGGGVLPDADLGLGGLGALPQVNTVPSLGKPKPSAARSMTISASQPTMILRATGGDWKVTVRVLSPQSSFAQFLIGNEQDHSIVVPAGSSQDLWLPKGQYLYAKGSTQGVCISASGGEG